MYVLIPVMLFFVGLAFVTGRPDALLPALMLFPMLMFIRGQQRLDREIEQSNAIERGLGQRLAAAWGATDPTEQPDIPAFWAEIDRQALSVPKVCRAGCSACCHQPIDITPAELPVIRDYIETNLDEETLRPIQAQARRVVAQYERTYQKHREMFEESRDAAIRVSFAGGPYLTLTDFTPWPITCPFLIDRRCSIYPVRPTMCRTYSVAEDPQACSMSDPRSPSDESLALMERANWVIADAAGSHRQRSLLCALPERLRVDQSRPCLCSEEGGD